MQGYDMLDDDTKQGLLIRLAKAMPPQEAAEKIIFYLTANRPQEGEGLNLRATARDPTVEADLRFAFEVAKDVVPSYEHVEQHGTVEEDGESTLHLKR